MSDILNQLDQIGGWTGPKEWTQDPIAAAAKEARPERADPKMVDWRTADVRMSEIHMFKDCPAWQQHTPQMCSPADAETPNLPHVRQDEG
jgi:hypothetical protein